MTSAGSYWSASASVAAVDLMCTELSDTAVAVLTPDRHIHAAAGGLDVQREGLHLPLDITLEVEHRLSF